VFESLSNLALTHLQDASDTSGGFSPLQALIAETFAGLALCPWGIPGYRLDFAKEVGPVLEDHVHNPRTTTDRGVLQLLGSIEGALLNKESANAANIILDLDGLEDFSPLSEDAWSKPDAVLPVLKFKSGNYTRQLANGHHRWRALERINDPLIKLLHEARRDKNTQQEDQVLAKLNTQAVWVVRVYSYSASQRICFS